MNKLLLLIPTLLLVACSNEFGKYPAIICKDGVVWHQIGFSSIYEPSKTVCFQIKSAEVLK